MATSTKNKVGRPSSYTQELADEIIELIRNGHSEREICKKRGMPSIKTLWNWKDRHPDFLQQSVRARSDSAEFYNDQRRQKADELYEIAKKHLEMGLDIPRGVVEAIKVSIQEDAREAGLRDDSRFGDRKRVAVTGADGGDVKIQIPQGIAGVMAIMQEWENNERQKG